jgi:Tfp pilus assembly protein PilW
MKAKNAQRKISAKGFTLVETLVYLALFVLIIGALVNCVVILGNSYRNVQSVQAIESSAIASMDRIIREARESTSIDTVNSTFGVSSNPVLALNSVNASGTAVAIKFSLSGGRIRLSENSVDLGPLTAADVEVSSLVFRQYTTSNSSAIKVEMTLSSASTSGMYFSKNFYGTAVLRGSY